MGQKTVLNTIYYSIILIKVVERQKIDLSRLPFIDVSATGFHKQDSLFARINKVLEAKIEAIVAGAVYIVLEGETNMRYVFG